MWLKTWPIKPFSVTLILLVLYYAINTGNKMALGLLLALLLCFVKQYWRQRQVFLWVGGLLLAFLVYFSFLHYKSGQIQKQMPTELRSVRLIPDSVTINGDKLSARGQVNGRNYQLYYTLQSQKEQHFFKTNPHTLNLQGKINLSRPEEQGNFQGFSYRAYLESQDIYQLGQIERLDKVSRVSPSSPWGVLQEWRRLAIVSIQQRFPNPMCHYMTGLLFGYLDKDFDQMSDLYTQLGIIHLFALSGMQVGFFLGWFRYGLLRLGFPKDYLLFVLLPFLLIYGVLTGWTASVLRSLVQALLAECGLKKLDNLAVTMGLLFFLLPHYLMSVGGVLSVTYAFLLSLFDLEHFSTIKKSIYSSLLLTLGVLPVLLYHYGVFQPASLVLTALFSLIFDLFLLPVLSIVFVLSPWLTLDFLNPLLVKMEDLLTWLTHQIGHPLVFGKPSLVQLLCLIGVLIILHDFWRRPRIRFSIIFLFVVGLLWVKYPLTNEVTLVNVGQGDSIFLRSLKGETLLIDVGGKVSFGHKEKWQEGSTTANAQRTLIPYLQARGVSQIDHLILTHTDVDHVGDLASLVSSVSVKEICVTRGALTKVRFVKQLRALKCPVRILSAGDRIPIMSSFLQVLYPTGVGDGGNNDSLVLYGELLHQRFLFTGDLEADGEDHLLTNYPYLKVDVLKVGHHGSKGSTSESFLDQIKPSMALISVGKHNRYNHPNTETIERLTQRHIRIYRTDQDGAVRLTGWWHWKIETVH